MKLHCEKIELTGLISKLSISIAALFSLWKQFGHSAWKYLDQSL